MTKTFNLILILFLTVVIILFLWQDIASKIEMKYDDLIAEYAHEYGVDPLLIKAVIWKESRFRPQKIGKNGEVERSTRQPDGSEQELCLYRKLR